MKGTTREWGRWIGDVTRVPEWFFDHGWETVAAVANRKVQFISEARAELRNALDLDASRFSARLSSLPFSVLDPDSDGAKTADLIARGAHKVSGLMQLVAENQEIRKEEGDASLDYTDILTNAFLAIPITTGHLKAVMALVVDYLQEQLDEQVHRARMGDREFGIVEEAFRSKPRMGLQAIAEAFGGATPQRASDDHDEKPAIWNTPLFRALSEDAIRRAAGGPASLVPFPADKLDANLLKRFLSGEKLAGGETAKIRGALDDDEVKQYLRTVAEAHGLTPPSDAELAHEFSLADATPRRAGDAPLPEPPGELGRRAREHLPTSADRERSQTPAEPDAQQGTGR
ncbi:MAG TPA: hypothetical protein VGY30_10700 [Solirubrobacteraceae bacterium]|nr:hypothetical protein [Solirubrobacteraceae bacterium]